MFGKREAQALRTEFWIQFGKIMAHQVSESGESVNWINYNTHVKGVRFRVEIEGGNILTSIDIDYADLSIQELHWDQFEETLGILKGFWGDFEWNRKVEGIHKHPIGRAWKQCTLGHIYDKTTWPDMFAYLKSEYLAFDAYWVMVYDVFEELRG